MYRFNTPHADFEDTIVMEGRWDPETGVPAKTMRHDLLFHGTGVEYFRIWIVNMALSLVTLGLFSPWAKVRRQRYFYSNTELDGARFEYHAKALNILAGRAFLLLMVLAGVWLGVSQSPWALLALLAGLLSMPGLIASSMRFKTRMVSWRGVRFAWQGSTGSVYRRSFKVAFLTVITLGIYYFAAHHAFKRLFVDRLQFGSMRFECSSTAGAFFGPYFVVGTITSLFSKSLDLVIPSLEGTPTAVVLGVVVLGVLYVTYQVLADVLSKTIQNQTRLEDELSFQNTATTTGLLALHLSNLLWTVTTLGLYWPWAQVRAMRYRCAHFVVVGDLKALRSYNVVRAKAAAFGQEAAGALDFDVGF